MYMRKMPVEGGVLVEKQLDTSTSTKTANLLVCIILEKTKVVCW